MDEGDEGWAGKDEVGVDVGILVGEFSVGIGTVSEGATPCKRTDGPDDGVGRENEYGGRWRVYANCRAYERRAARVRTVAVVASIESIIAYRHPLRWVVTRLCYSTAHFEWRVGRGKPRR